MGKPPRVADFQKAAKSAVWLEADWGLIHTIGIRDLVELKKTQRVEDYPIIGNLALQYFNSIGPGTSIKPAERNELDRVVSLADEESWKWAIDNIFTLASLRTFFEQHPRSIDALTQAIPEAVIEFGRRVLLAGDVDAGTEEAANRWMQERSIEFQKQDRQYWRSIINELRVLRSEGKLMKEGSPVVV